MKISEKMSELVIEDGKISLSIYCDIFQKKCLDPTGEKCIECVYKKLVSGEDFNA